MFSNLTGQLRDQIARIESILLTHDRLRAVIFESDQSAPALQADSAIDPECRKQLLALLGTDLPSKVDWQIYDHCAAFTRIYATYEQFVNDLVSNYVALLPQLYESYDDLPEGVSINHRIGLGQILIKIGSRKQYKQLEESAVIRALASGLAGSSGYSLVPEAFTADQRNYKFDVLVELFSQLGIENFGQRIVRHPEVINFMRTTRGESDTVQGELGKLVDYRNEAAHRTVDNIVAVDEIRKMGAFICVVGDALAEIVELTVVERRMELGKSMGIIGAVTEVYEEGSIVVARMSKVHLEVGESIIVYRESKGYSKAKVLSIQVEDIDKVSVNAEEGQELGIRLSKRTKVGSKLLRLLPVDEKTVEVQLPSEESMAAMTDESGVEAVQREPLGTELDSDTVTDNPIDQDA
jgi:hypothetical protein